jgi:hypothetical protein
VGIHPFSTPHQRREEYLRNAAEAQSIADRAHSESARERYQTLALFWTTLANEVGGLKTEHSSREETR